MLLDFSRLMSAFRKGIKRRRFHRNEQRRRRQALRQSVFCGEVGVQSELLEDRTLLSNVAVVVDTSDDSAKIIDLDTNTIVDSVDFPNGPAAGDVVVTADSSLAFVTNFRQEVYAIDLTTNSLANGGNPIAVSTLSEELEITADGQYLLVSDGSNGLFPFVSVVEIASLTEIGTFDAGHDVNSLDTGPGGEVVFTSWNTDQIRRLAIDAAGNLTDTGDALAVIDPLNIHLAPDGQTGIVVHTNGGLTAFSTPGLAPQNSVTIGTSGMRVGAFSPDGQTFYVRAGDGMIYSMPFDPVSGTIGTTPNWSVQGTAIGNSLFAMEQMTITEDGRFLYVPEGSDVVVRSTQNGAAQQTISSAGSTFTGIGLNQIPVPSTLVGVDFGLPGTSSPTNWSLYSVAGDGSLNDLSDERGSGTPIDLSIDIQDDLPVYIDSTIIPADLPQHTQPLNDVEGNIFNRSLMTMTYSDLTPGTSYELFVFGADTVPNEQTIVIVGAGTTSFTQNYEAGQLYVNGERGSSMRDLGSFAEVMAADQSGEIRITVANVGNFSGVAGVAIREAGEFLSTAEIRGSKWHDLDGNGIQNGNESNLPGWTVYVDLNNDGSLDPNEPSTITDAAGNYTFLGLAPGTYNIREIMQPGWGQTFPGPSPNGANTVQVAANEILSNVRFGNAQLTTIRGVKWHDVDGNGSQGFGEASLPGWTIYADLNDNGILDGNEPSDVTNGQGRYTISGLLPGQYTIREILQTGWVQTFPTAGAGGGRLFTYSATSGLIQEVDPQSGAVLNAFASPVASATGPDLGLATTPSSLIVGGNNGQSIFLLDPSTGATQSTITNPGVNVSGLAVLNNELYALDDPSGTVTVFNLGNGSVVRTLSVAAAGIQEGLGASTTTLYGTSGNGLFSIDPFTGATTSIGSLLGTTNFGEGVGFIGDELFIADFDNIDVYDLATLTLKRTLTGFNNLEAIGADGGGSGAGSGFHLVSLTSGQSVNGINFGNANPGSFEGIKWDDNNGDGIQDPGEQPLAGWTIYIDQNNNSRLDAGEPSTVTDANGEYSFSNLVPGQYIVREIIQAGWEQTSPTPTLYRLFGIDPASNDIIELDINTGAEINRINLPAFIFGANPLAGLAFDGTSLFFGGGFFGGGANTLYQIDPDTGAVIDQDDFGLIGMVGGDSVDGLGFLNGDIIATNSGDDQIFFINPGADIVTRVITAAMDIEGGATGADSRGFFGTIFATTANGQNILELSPFDGSVINMIPSPTANPSGLAFIDGELYVGDSVGFQVTVIDPDTGAVLRTLAPVTQTAALAGDDNFVFIEGFWTASVFSGGLTSGIDFGNRLERGDAEISGIKFEDLNGDGIQDPGELGLGGWTIYLDNNNNGSLDPGEIFTVTQFDDPATPAVDESGMYTITGVPTGIHVVREVLQPEWQQTAPLAGTMNPNAVSFDGFWEVTIMLGNEIVPDVNFGNQSTVDFGDAPDPLYPTLRASDGARHIVDPAIALGTLIDVESEGQQTPDASGDGTDDDGVAFSSGFVAGATNMIDVTATSAGELVFWVDFDLSGTFDPAERFTHTFAAAGTETIAVAVPAGAVQGNTFARFRFSTDGAAIMTPTGLAPDGEVEDYLVAIGGFASISGLKFHDLNGDGIQDAGEPPLAGWTIYIDANDDSVFNAGEQFDVTAADGTYTISNVLPGTHTVREVVQLGWIQTSPGSDWTVTVAPSEVLTGIDFGNEIHRDFGDAPDPTYPTLLANNGASHLIDPAVFLGMAVDGEPDGQPTVDATGDGADEDGVVFPADIIVGAIVTMDVTASTAGELAFWLDFDQSGTFDPSERFTHTFAVAGTESIAVAIPAAAVLGDTFARFRFSTDGAAIATPTGLAPDGEVEDYQVTISDSPEIQGTKFEDRNGDGIKSLNEPGLAGWTIYVDANDNGVLDSGEVWTVTNDDDPGTPQVDETGTYVLSGFAPGTYNIREILQPGWEQTTPTGGWLGRLFAHDGAAGNIHELDLTTGGVLNTFASPIASTDAGLAITRTEVIVAGGLNDISRLDPNTGAVLPGTITNPGLEINALAVLGNELFLAQDSPRRMVVIDLTTDTVVRTVITPFAFQSLAASSTTLFAATGTDLYQVDPITGGATLVGTLAGAGTPTGLGIIGDELFVEFTSGIQVYDLTTLAPTSSFTLPSGIQAIGADGGAAGGFTPVTVAAGQVISGIDFGNRIFMDFGDAPDPTYPTLLASDGARHAINRTIHLGATIDGEANGQPNAGATGDGADEDGVAIPIGMVPGHSSSVDVTASSAGTLNYWIDFDGSGTFDAAERFTHTFAAAGTETLTFDVPAAAIPGDTFARFRFSTDAAAVASPTGFAPDGETEDYQVTVSEAATISGLKFHDLNGDGVYDAGTEPGLAGWTIYLDDNDNMMFDAGEQFAVTQMDGTYTIVSVVPGPHLVREVLQPGWIQTAAPLNPVVTVAGQDSPDNNFGNQIHMDFGDAPDPTYSTLFANDGARHIIDPAIVLGVLIDGESDGQQSADASGDGADDDGVIFNGPFTAGFSTTIDVTASSEGDLVYWFDFDGSGTFDPAEQFSHNFAQAGTETLTVSVPANAAIGDAFARFRFSTDRAAITLPTGRAPDGETEDYQLQIEAPGEIQGIKFNDLDGDGTQGANEPGLSGWTIYLDLNNNAVLDAGEPSVVTQINDTQTPTVDETGFFEFVNVASGDYIVREVLQPGWVQTSPLNPDYHQVTVTMGNVVPRDMVKFGNQVFSDFGDAPDPTYPTLIASSGARHVIDPNIFLGLTVDGESEGQPTADATGDGADEDGVVFVTQLITGQTAEIAVTASAAGELAFWIDLDQSGTFDPAERVTHTFAAAGTETLNVPIPAGISDGNTFARFRFSTDGAAVARPTGFAPDGEVEDYLVAIEHFARIEGVKFEDLNGDGIQDAGESALAGWTIYLDSNNNGLLDAGERSTVTLADDPLTPTVDETGTYAFDDVLPSNTYFVREVLQPGWIQTSPVGQAALLGISFSGVLYDVNADTGLATNPRPTGLDKTIGIAEGPESDLFTITTFLSNSQPNSLYRINSITNDVTLVGPTGLTDLFEGDLDFDPVSGTLYGLQTGGTSSLFTVDINTGAATIVGSPLGLVDFSAMSFDDTGRLFLLETDGADELVEVNPADGTVISRTNLTGADLGVGAGMEYDPVAGTLYVVDGGSRCDQQLVHLGRNHRSTLTQWSFRTRKWTGRPDRPRDLQERCLDRDPAVRRNRDGDRLR